MEERPHRSGCFDLAGLGREFVDDPHSTLAEIREEDRIRRVVYHGVPAWLVTRFEDAERIYSDPRISSDFANAEEQVRAVPWISGATALGVTKGMHHLDPPEHTRLRRLTAQAFTSRRVDALRPTAGRICAELLDAALARDQIDFLHDFAIPLGCRVMMTVLGVPDEDTSAFEKQAGILVSTDPADVPKLPETMRWLDGYFEALITAKRKRLGDDLLSELMAPAGDDEPLDDAELRAMTHLMLTAGFATTANLISNGLLALLEHPGQFAVLRDDRALLPAAIEEMLRYEPPAIVALPKFAKEDLTFAGVRIRRGEAVVISIAAANRDQRRFPTPDGFDILRPAAGHLSFGHGIHTCIGRQLARMEAQVAFTALLERCRDVMSAVPISTLSWRVSYGLRMLNSFPVTLTPTAPHVPVTR
jgi:cytochrome P450